MAGSVLRKIDVKLDHGGMRRLLQSSEVRSELERRARAVAQAAGPGFAVSATSGRRRALAMVYAATPQARAREARDRVLTRAIDAARG